MAVREARLSEEPVANAAPKVRARTRNRSTARQADASREPPRDDFARDEREVDENLEDVGDAERFQMFRDSIVQSVLPDIPSMPGYHVCWLTTANPRDTIANRIRWGYELVTQDMVPGFQGAGPKSGEYPGVISVNEMVAGRIPLRLYNRYMTEMHHTLPLSEEEKIRARIDQSAVMAEEVGSRLEEDEGMASIVKRAKPMPEFQS